MLEITPDDIANLNDEDVRGLVGRLCEAEVLARGLQASGVTWGGNQNAADGGIDVRVELPTDAVCHGFLPRRAIGFQVKKPDMAPAAIAAEMRPDGNIRPSIQQLADRAGAYIIVSSGAHVSDSALKDRRDAMARAVGDVANAPALFLDFYDRSRLATWVRAYAGLIPWVRQKAGRPLQGWRPYEGWALAPDGVEDVYLADDTARLHGGNRDANGLPISDGIKRLRDSLRDPCGVARLAGLSGVGKTRLIQALFDPRVGAGSLDPGLAVYTDIADSPDPPPTAMAEDLIARRMRAILIVDNCPRELHRRLAETCRKPDSTISVVTIEYDIQEDEPEGTDAYFLEPSSAELIKKIVRRRFKDISPVDAETIATFSGGNARVALALASTLDSRETLAGLGDEELFRRLFHQRNAPDENLMRAAEVCSLVYSFEGETLVGDKAELAKLASLAELTTQDLYGRVRELKRRDLVQQRSVWRAVLPHAIANRLAKRALQNYPIQTIEATMDTERLLKSFAHRLSYLHDSPEARQLAARWLEADGLLGEVGELNELGRGMFDFIAPVAPGAVLAALERATARNGADLRGLARHARLLRSLAYDSENFARSVGVLLTLASSEDNQSANFSHGVTDTFSSLFQICYSGTEAPIGLRAPIINELLHSDQPERRAFGMKALEEALRTSHFNVTQPFEFGARPRNYGWWPKSAQDIADWYGAMLRIVEAVVVSDLPVAQPVRDVLARKFRGLWRTGAVTEELERITAKIADHVYWQDGWIAVRKTQSQPHKDMPPEVGQRLDTLERLLRPKDIIERTRVVVLTESWGPLDYADAEEDDGDDGDGQKMMRRIERASEMAQELGGSVGGDAKAFAELLPDLVRGKGGRLGRFGTGLGSAPGDRRARWQALVSALRNVPPGERNLGVIAGYLTGLAGVEPGVANALLDGAVEDAVLGPWLPALQMAVPIDADGLQRLSRALEVGLAPIGMFGNLAGGRYADSVPGPDFRQLVSAIAGKPGGYGVAADVLSMRIFSDRSAKKEVAPELIEAGRTLLEGIVFERGNHMQDYRLSEIAKACLASPEAGDTAIAIAGRLRTAAAGYALSIYDYDQFVLALLKVQPRAALDGFFGGSEDDREAGRQVIEQIAMNQDNALDGVPDAVVLAWCEESRAERYAFMAQVVTYARSTDKASLQWTPLARAMLDQAPEPVTVLAIFVERFSPMTWNGSRAAEFEERARLLDDLADHPDKALSAYAAEQRRQLADTVARYRRAEAEEHRDRDERFE
jgi:hypothetical protein